MTLTPNVPSSVAEPAPTRVATYARVSSDDQAERGTIATQRDVLERRIALTQGIHVVGRFEDDGVSGTIPFADRPGGRDLVALAESGRLDRLWVFRVDRLGRDPIDLMVLRRRLDPLGVTIVSMEEGEQQGLPFDINAVVSGYARETFLRLTAHGIDRAAREGRYLGGPAPYGYRVEGERKKDVRLVVDDRVVSGTQTAADIIRHIYERLALDDWSCDRVADELNDLGVPTHRQLEQGTRRRRTRGVWRGGRIRNMVVSPVYRGESRFGRRSKKEREVISAPVPALVSAELWQAAQEALARHRICARNTTRVHLLRSVIACGRCGLNYIGSVGRDGVVWYRCNGQLKHRGPIEGRCPSRSVKSDHLEPVIWQDIERSLRRPGDLLEELDPGREREGEAARRARELSAIEAALGDLTTQRRAAQRLVLRGSMTDTELDTELTGIDADRAALERRKASLEPPAEEPVDIDLLGRLRAQARRRPHRRRAPGDHPAAGARHRHDVHRRHGDEGRHRHHHVPVPCCSRNSHGHACRSGLQQCPARGPPTSGTALAAESGRRMTDLGPSGAGHDGIDLELPPRFSTAEEVNPPVPGDPGYEDYVERRAAWMRWVDRQRAKRTDLALDFTPYYDAGLGRMVTPDDPAPITMDPPDRSDGFGPSAESRADTEPTRRTDAANGEFFARVFGDRVRYDHRRGRWLIFREHRWLEDYVGAIRLLGKMAARQRYGDAAAIEDLDERSREARFAITSENRYRLEAMLVQARSEPPIADAGDRWDADPWLLGVTNGVVDLRTGALRPGHPSDSITLSSTVMFAADAGCPRWERFLAEVFDGDGGLIGFIQRAAGYSLTGQISEQVLFLLHGTGANGKSVLLTVLRWIGGTYAYNAPFSTFELQNRASIPNDLAALAGRRLVTASEVTENARINDARIKSLTGGDKLTARFLHAEFFEFEPVLKLWLAVNHLPVVLDDSHGFWRRVRLVPFTCRFEEGADPTLVETLRGELPGILAWAVRGAVAWSQRGLDSPDAVLAATRTYREESDPLAEFLSARCLAGEGLEMKAQEAYRSYRAWAEAEGLRDREVLSAKAFGTRLTVRLTKRVRKTGKVYLGVGLLDEHRRSLGDGSGDGS